MLSILNQENYDKVKRETYVQFPGFPPPAELFGGTWGTVFDDESVFFRTPGAASLPFNGGIQLDAMVDLPGLIEVEGLNAFGTGVFANGPTHVARPSNVRSSPVTIKSIKLDISKAYRIASELRVKNRTIRVWYLISM